MEDHGQRVLKVPSDHTTTGVCVQIDCVPCPDPQSFAARNWIDEIASKQLNSEKHCFRRHGMTSWGKRHNAKHKGRIKNLSEQQGRNSKRDNQNLYAIV